MPHKLIFAKQSIIKFTSSIDFLKLCKLPDKVMCWERMNLKRQHWQGRYKASEHEEDNEICFGLGVIYMRKSIETSRDSEAVPEAREAPVDRQRRILMHYNRTGQNIGSQTAR